MLNEIISSIKISYKLLTSQKERKKYANKALKVIHKKAENIFLSNKEPKNWQEAFTASSGKQANKAHKLLQKESKRLTGSTNYKSFNFTKARASAAGCHWYIWRTCEDSMVRLSHQEMAGVIVNYTEPPKKLGHHAGELPDCRCYDEPLIRADQSKWPAKVYYKGKIQKMSFREFKNICKDDIF